MKSFVNCYIHLHGFTCHNTEKDQVVLISHIHDYAINLAIGSGLN